MVTSIGTGIGMEMGKPHMRVGWVAGAAAGGIAAFIVLHAALAPMAERTARSSGGSDLAGGTGAGEGAASAVPLKD